MLKRIKCGEYFSIDNGTKPSYGNGCNCKQEFICTRPKHHKGKHQEIVKDSNGNPTKVMWMKVLDDSEKLKLCIGCNNNRYNFDTESRCCSFSFSKIVFKKKVHIDQKPPWEQEPIEVLSCYCQKRYIFVEKDHTY